MYYCSDDDDDRLKKESNMEGGLQKSKSLRLNRRGDRSNQNLQAKGKQQLVSILLIL